MLVLVPRQQARKWDEPHRHRVIKRMVTRVCEGIVI
jgi:hypothetical protein